ncbi:muts domain V-domain-containing protein [Pisolithus orientalis]|uniref:muts domain V-domain-containing protein n=1 Tax=Pisolithus orientalis TaxID=936130 RepID=UPI002224844F|nr:muts domain V-domain-containing protein [Pisolithus orientalis]KAI6005192.1 muts domain V-domain-containing protein [Pisolithus orientalis]
MAHRVRLIRVFHSSAGAFEPKRPSVTITKKKYSELPRKQLSASETAPVTCDALSASVLSNGNNTPFHPSPAPGISEPIPRPRRRKAKRPSLHEILTNLKNFPHCILLTRVGQFYESYFDQAEEVASLLGIKLTSRVWDKQNITMCGFPLMHLDKYLKVLVLHHKRFVAMCEEFPLHKPGQKPAFERRVVRVITPGTLIDEPFLDHCQNNYLLAIAFSLSSNSEKDTGTIGLAWIDVSTGEFFTKTLPLEGLKDHLARICPGEIVLPDELKSCADHPVRKAVEDEDILVAYTPPSATVRAPLDDPPSDSSISGTYTAHELEAVNILTNYMRLNLLEHMPQLSNPSREVRESAREGGTAGSLLSVVKRTVTSSGTRLLSRRLCSPSTSVREIGTRQSLVAFFYDRPYLREDIVQSLKECEDTLRIVQMFLLRKGELRDLLSIHRTIEVWMLIQRRLELERKMETLERGTSTASEWGNIDAMMSSIADLQSLSHRIASALDDVESADPSTQAPEEDDVSQEDKAVKTIAYNGVYKWTVRPDFAEELAELHQRLSNLLDRRRTLERELQVQYNAPSLTLRTSPGQGMHVHLARAKRDQSKIKSSPEFISISENASTGSFFYLPWSQLGNQIVEIATAISNAEKEIFDTLLIMDELDVTIGFANLAAEFRLTRPVVKDGTGYEVIHGRHPTVELGLLTSGRVFTPNSVSLKADSQLHIITGPNMAGKSTFLRQTAIIAILAQTGSFVPAEHAVIGVVDRLFSRVGAKDDLFRDRSTFMVEMLETAEILRRATPKSLVIMDEVGRGTTVRDGLAIAFATVHHLVVNNRCRALFATHFHELADLLSYSEVDHHGGGVFRGVGFFCTDVRETEDGYFTYSHCLRPGVNRDSHALKVAQLAGMPTSAVLLAKNVLSALQGQQHLSVAQLSQLGQMATTTE